MPAATQNRRGPLLGAFLCVVSAIVYVVLPGTPRSPFSGIPLSSMATAVFTTLVGLLVFICLFRPRRSVRAAFPISILVLCAVKMLVAPSIVPNGWRGEYAVSKRIKAAPPTYAGYERMWFHVRGVAARPYRDDRAIDFLQYRFIGADFLNELPVPDGSTEERASIYPLRVRWTGWAYAESPRDIEMTTSATGTVDASIDGRVVLSRSNPQNSNAVARIGAGLHKVVVVYVKPAGVVPAVEVRPSFVTTAVPADVRAIRRSEIASRVMDAIGWLAIVLTVSALWWAYRPVAISVIDEAITRPSRTLTVVLIAFILAIGLRHTIPVRHLTTELSVGNDPLVYESDSRLIARNGPLLVYDNGNGAPYFFYPFYSYALAIAHIIFGDDLSAGTLFNYYCIAASMLLLWIILRRRITENSLCVVMLVFGAIAQVSLRYYAETAFTDNLFLPIVLGLLIVSAAGLESLDARWLFAAGVLTALGAATRPSLTTHLPVFFIAILLYRDFGDLKRRIMAAFAFAGGFVCGVAPFTIRNWIVARRFILIVESQGALMHFLFAPEEKETTYLINGRVPTLSEAISQVVGLYASRPLHYTWVEIRKVLFTLGLTTFGPFRSPDTPRYLFIFTLLCIAALFYRRVPRPLVFTIVAFGISHISGMVVGVPWTYGYKSILPFMTACLIGAAFLLRKPDERCEAMLNPPADADTSLTVVMPRTNPAVVEEMRAALGSAHVIGGDDSVDWVDFVRRNVNEVQSPYIVVSDARYGAADVRKLLPFRAEYDMVCGAREAAEGVAEVRRSAWVGRWLSLLFPCNIRDAGCRLWLMRTDAARELVMLTTSRRPADFMLEMLILAQRRGNTVVQVPVAAGPEDPTDERSLSGWLRQVTLLLTPRV